MKGSIKDIVVGVNPFFAIATPRRKTSRAKRTHFNSNFPANVLFFGNVNMPRD